MAKPLKGLGRGLDALLSGIDADSVTEDALRSLDITLLQPGKYQPRTRMDQDSLAELAESIKAQGVVQPILVRQIESGNYEIIAGERRWRAARMAGLAEIPALVREIPDEATLAISLIENIQREDLNPLEESRGIKRLIDEFGMTHEAAAGAVGKSRSAVSNLLRLQNLAPPVQELLMDNRIDMGHARALLALDAARQTALGKEIAEKGLSVREVENLTREEAKPPVAKPVRKADPDVLRLQEEVSEKIGTRVVIQTSRGGKGKLTIEYASHEHLDELLDKLRV